MKHWCLIFMLAVLSVMLCSCGGTDETTTGPTNPGTLQTGTVTDSDGHTYRTVKIGGQWWMAENLQVLHYRNGDPVPNVTDSSDWAHLSSGAYCNFANNPGYVSTYGRLYNWYAATDQRGIAPVGWHVPTQSDWLTLEQTLGLTHMPIGADQSADTDSGRSIEALATRWLVPYDTLDWEGTVGGALKEIGTAHWLSPNTGATNVTGFAALPAGHRLVGGWGIYNGLGQYAYYWSTTEYVNQYGNTHVWFRSISHTHVGIYRSGTIRAQGLSIRCVRD